MKARGPVRVTMLEAFRAPAVHSTVKDLDFAWLRGGWILTTRVTETAGVRLGARVFHVVLIKPSHYDDDGYPIQFRKSAMPSNTLACLLALAEDASERAILGDDVDIRVHAIDETNQRVVPADIIDMVKAGGGQGLIALVGVQSNQFCRAVDIGRVFRAASFPVCIGGFHVSGCLAMLPETPPEIREAQALGISIFGGEAEARRLDGVIRDAWSGALAPLYNYMDDLPALQGEPVPFLRREHVARVYSDLSCVDLGRGCPFQCSFCTIINVQGRKTRNRSPDDLERIVRKNYIEGIKHYIITDDNFARNRDWEALFDRIIKLRREEHMDVQLQLQVDTQCHLIPQFIEKAAAAGTRCVFIGLENINPDNLIAAKKRQNKITEYRAMIQKWRDYGVITIAGYILGFPNDTRASLERDVEILKRELPLDIVEFFYLTPLPGSEDHKVLWQKGVWMDPDLNKYDLNHRVMHHPRMTDDEWEDAYNTAWSSFYSPDHIRTILRRAVANGRIPLSVLCNELFKFANASEIEHVHPLETGIGRMRFGEDRRHGMQIEDPLLFEISAREETGEKARRYTEARQHFQAILKDVLSAPDRLSYRDVATTRVEEQEFASLDLYHATGGSEAALARKRRADTIRESGQAGPGAEPHAH
jgi:hypothetical protein